MNIGKTISEIRKEQKMSQEEFGKLFHVTRQTVSNWENEKSYPDLQTLVKISDMFEVSLDRLLKEDEQMVKEITKIMKEGKQWKVIKSCLLIFLGVLILSGGIYGAVWGHQKTVLESYFQNGMEAHGFQYSEKDGDYTKVHENVTFELPNQKMPDFFDLSLNFHAKSLYGTVTFDEGNGTLTWLEGDWIYLDFYLRETGDNDEITSCLIDENGDLFDGYGKKIHALPAPAEKFYQEHREELRSVVQQGCEIYRDVYKD
ncbi:MAG: helix-turn-helix transcriptional regulator [Bacillota bacterium]|nr:helix-turn-helix transcriptional regulator [Bacillota bacterium]